MLQLSSSDYADAVRGVNLAARRLEDLERLGLDSRVTANLLLHFLANLKLALGEIELSPPLVAMLERLRYRLQYDDVEDVSVRTAALQLLDEFQTSVTIELRSYVYLAIPNDDRALFEDGGRWFGAGVAATFPDAESDIRDCARAISLGLWTASVFHAMRAVQHALHLLAARVNVAFARDIELLNWGEIIKSIDKRLKEIEQTPKTASRDQQLQFATAASSHFFAIKEAWRNYVMHGRSTYDEVEARTIAQAVRSIMVALA